MKNFISQNSDKLGLKQPGQNSKLYGIYRDFSKFVSGQDQREDLANESFSDRLKQMQKSMMIL